MSRLAALFAGLVLATACASGARGAAGSTLPVIERVTPSTGPAGSAYPIEVEIVGRNFDDSLNTVTFGAVRLTRVRSDASGTRIVFQAPKSEPATGEVPPGPLLPGAYEIRVTTAAGTSNPVTFSLTREPGGSA
jgi:hypothetical protein